METVDCSQKYKVVVDYAHTPDALRVALSMLRECTPGNLHALFLGVEGIGTVVKEWR